MKCVVENDRLVVRGLLSVRFKVASSDLREVKVMTELAYYGPLMKLRQRVFGNKIRLRFVMLQTVDSQCTIDMDRDTGASNVVRWLRESGWDMDGAIESAVGTPLVRTAVSRLKSY